MAAQSPSSGLLYSFRRSDGHDELGRLDAADAEPHLEAERVREHRPYPDAGRSQDERQSLAAGQSRGGHPSADRRAGCVSDAWDGVRRGIVPEGHPAGAGLILEGRLGGDQKWDGRVANRLASVLWEQLAEALGLVAAPYTQDAVQSVA